MHAEARGQGWGITIHWALQYLDVCLPEDLRERLLEVQVDPEQGKVDNGNFLFLNMKTGEIDSKIPPSKRLRLKRESFRKLLMEDLPVQVGFCGLFFFFGPFRVTSWLRRTVG